MAIYLKKFENHTQYDNYINGSGAILPNVSICTQEGDVHYNPIPYDYSQDYLTFEAVTDGTITITAMNDMSIVKTLSYSTDNGDTWTELTTSPAEKSFGTFKAGDKILFKGKNLAYANNNKYTKFGGTAQFNVYGNIMSLVYGDDFVGETQINSWYTFYNLFMYSKVVNAENLVLPTTSLLDFCYEGMFDSCTSLTTAPQLLPATTLGRYCYYQMFNGCTSLTTAPQLPATTLTQRCYCSMFNGCTSLTTAPQLPATTLADDCYLSMFHSCTSLTTAPELPATTLVSGCYNYMFSGCTSLNYIKAMFTTTPSTSYMNKWVSDVASSGTFVKNSAATWAESCGTSTYPCNWTVQTANN